jgi:hypothetical protein
MENLLIVITTCKNYFLHTNIVEKVKEAKLNNVIIVSGQEESDEIIYLDGIKVIKVKYTGLHHTGAIYIKENYDEFDTFKYFMFLPDTIKFGENFMNNICKYYNKYIKNNNLQVIGFINTAVRPSMDMCILNIEHINNISEYFSKIKTFDVSYNNLVKLKRTLIYDENTILGQQGVWRDGIKGTKYIKIVKPEDKIFLCNNANDIIETRINEIINQVYLPLLDLYKFQRNFNGPNVNLKITY